MAENSSFVNALINRGFSQEAAQNIDKYSTTMTLEKGESFKPSCNLSELFYINNGVLVSEYETNAARVMSNIIYCAGSVIYTPLCGKGKENNHVPFYRTYSPVTISILHGDHFDDLKASDPSIIRYFSEGYNNQLLYELETTLCLSVAGKKARIAAALAYINSFNLSDSIELSIEEVSVITNVTRQYCTKAVNELVKQGCITRNNNNITVLSFESLCANFPEDVATYLQERVEKNSFSLY